MRRPLATATCRYATPTCHLPCSGRLPFTRRLSEQIAPVFQPLSTDLHVRMALPASQVRVVHLRGGLSSPRNTAIAISVRALLAPVDLMSSASLEYHVGMEGVTVLRTTSSRPEVSRKLQGTLRMSWSATMTSYWPTGRLSSYGTMPSLKHLAPKWTGSSKSPCQYFPG